MNETRTLVLLGSLALAVSYLLFRVGLEIGRRIVSRRPSKSWTQISRLGVVIFVLPSFVVFAAAFWGTGNPHLAIGRFLTSGPGILVSLGLANVLSCLICLAFDAAGIAVFSQADDRG